MKNIILTLLKINIVKVSFNSLLHLLYYYYYIVYTYRYITYCYNYKNIRTVINIQLQLKDFVLFLYY